jgi:hypothetical protein
VVASSNQQGEVTWLFFQEGRQRLPGRDRHPEPPDQGRPDRARDQPHQRERPEPPRFRAEIGAAWSKRSEEGRDYLSLKLDDPSFNAPIYANLFDDEEGDGYWSRPRKSGD